MFRKYGILGLVMIAFAEINFILKIQPFANWYFLIVWFGYIFVIDSLIYRLKKNSLISSRFKLFLAMLALSAVFWWTFEILNLAISSWGYNNVFGITALSNVFRKTLYFSTVLPAVLETAELLKTIHLFNHAEFKKTHKISKIFLYIMVLSGIFCLVAPIIIKNIYFAQIMWLGFFLLLDPFNYIHHKPSIIGHFKDRKLAIPLALFAGGTICGFFWEFWNYWAVTKWTYTMPDPFGIKIFEMPLLGYICYGPFAWSLYAMYNFAETILHGKAEKV